MLLICDAAPFTVGLVQLSLGNRKRGSSVTDLAFAIVMFKSDENKDCATLEGKKPNSKVAEFEAWQNWPLLPRKFPISKFQADFFVDLSSIVTVSLCALLPSPSIRASRCPYRGDFFGERGIHRWHRSIHKSKSSRKMFIVSSGPLTA